MKLITIRKKYGGILRRSVCCCAQIISNREFKLWTFLQGTESRVATFLAETFCNVSPVPVHAFDAKSQTYISTHIHIDMACIHASG